MAGIGPQTVSARLAEFDGASIGGAALAGAAAELAAAVRADLSAEPGGEHRFPWRRSGRLAASIDVTCTDDAAVVGSTDPVAVDQELGTATLPPRPFLAAAAANKGPDIVSHLGEHVREPLRRMFR